MIWTHDRIYFYKYASASTAYKIIDTKTIKCSSPLIFNDPFDTLLELRYSFELKNFPRLLLDRIRDMVLDQSIKIPMTTTYGIMLNEMRKHRENYIYPVPYEALKPDLMSVMKQGETVLKEEERKWHSYLKDYRIFCVSEEYDNLLMWAHYADNHKGAVLRFKCVPELDSAFCAAIKVKYQKDKPTLGTFDQVFNNHMGLDDIDFVKKNEDMIYIKNDHWQYEKEWRYPLKKIGLDDPYFDLRSFSEEELDGVFIGCRMDEAYKKKIFQAIKQNFSFMGIYLAKPSRNEYKLNFKRI